MIKEHYDLIRGKGLFIDDINLKGQLYLYIIRSPYARARILRIDPPSRNFELFMSWSDVRIRMPVSADPRFARNIVSMPVLADGMVNFRGQPVAAVVVRDKYSAEDVAEELSIEYEPLKPVVSINESIEGSTHIHPGGNVSVDAVLRGGDLSLLRSADVVVERELSQGRVIPNPMETRGCVANYDGDTLFLYVSAQSPFRVKEELQAMLGLHNVVVTAPNVGGGFGSKVSSYPEYVLAALASMRLRRPVKWVESRMEHLNNPIHGRGVYSKMRMYSTRSGVVLGIEGEIIVDLGAYNYSINPTIPIFIARLSTGPYRVKAASVRAMGVFTNLPPTGPYRGAGRPEAALIHETLIEDLAEELGMDPVELRRRNLIGHEGYETPLGLRIDGAGYGEVLDRAEVYYREARSKYRGGHRGVSIVVFTELVRVSPGEGAKVRLRDGVVEVVVGSGPHGQAHASTFAKLAGEVLNVPPESVKVILGTTEHLKEGIGSYGSRSTTIGGSAVIEAARRIISMLQSRGLSLREALEQRINLEAEVFYTGEDIFAPGAHVAVVDVDPETMIPRVLEYYAVDDVGRVIIREEVEGQIMGGVVQGASQVLWEAAIFDAEGNPLHASLADVGVPTALEASFRITVQEVSTPSSLPSGARGVGESGTIGGLAAVFLALEKAVGRKLRGTPVMPEDLIVTSTS